MNFEITGLLSEINGIIAGGKLTDEHLSREIPITIGFQQPAVGMARLSRDDEGNIQVTARFTSLGSNDPPLLADDMSSYSIRPAGDHLVLKRDEETPHGSFSVFHHATDYWDLMRPDE